MNNSARRDENLQIKYKICLLLSSFLKAFVQKRNHSVLSYNFLRSSDLAFFLPKNKNFLKIPLATFVLCVHN